MQYVHLQFKLLLIKFSLSAGKSFLTDGIIYLYCKYDHAFFRLNITQWFINAHRVTSQHSLQHPHALLLIASLLWRVAFHLTCYIANSNLLWFLTAWHFWPLCLCLCWVFFQEHLSFFPNCLLLLSQEYREQNRSAFVITENRNLLCITQEVGVMGPTLGSSRKLLHWA